MFDDRNALNTREILWNLIGISLNRVELPPTERSEPIHIRSLRNAMPSGRC